MGLGTYRLTPVEIGPVIRQAMGSGIELIDTAVSYRHSHAALADALRGADARPMWIQTKIPPAEQGFEKARACALRCATDLSGCAANLSILLHWPGGAKLPADSPLHAELRLGSWLALQELYAEGLVQCIGVSNFTERHLLELERAPAVRVLPFVNQVELHPLLPQAELRAFCSARAIHVQAYSSLGQGAAGLWQQPALRAVASRAGVSEAHALLLWAMQQGVSVLPRTSKPERVRANALALDAVRGGGVPLELGALDRLADGTHFCWNGEDIL